ncbi:NLP/P60 protein [Paenibacillus curdlanolyticus YK9]|uniref:NLP/P60 protein n=1 Tax=Paenibacillus curdlanolyticus YK9 TaxID=717606 RepID=E0I7D1_9BACL|nr:SH3 domain-containing C40 family peptidase [Paenibacillus curdlanolyticus]EFM11947.1 NLP/P60 protein [Paenibacillus curdlanolyticus YK9]
MGTFSSKMKKPLITASVTAMLALGAVAAPAADVWAAQVGTATVQAGVNMRTQPSTAGSVIRLLKQGESIVVLEQTNAYWYKVQDSRGAIGYVSTSSQYLSVTSSGAPSQGNTNGTIVATVTLRTSPSTSGSAIGYLHKNDQVQVLSAPNAYWYEVADQQGRRGYISSQSKYVTVNGTVPGGSAGNGGGNPSTPDNGAGTGDNAAKIEQVIATGMKYLGTPYEFGSDRNTTTTFDCSDLVRTMFLEGIGLKLPADSRQQGEYVQNKGNAVTDWHQLKRGDLIFFMSYKGSSASAYAGIDKSKQKITHDGIYLGNGQVLHTYSKESGGVKISSIAGTHWEYRFVYGGSAL